MKRFLANIMIYIGLVFLCAPLVEKVIAQEYREYFYPYIGKISPSPDGRYIAFDLDFPLLDNEQRLCVVNVLTKEIYELPREYLGVAEPNPAWCPDGSVIAFEACEIYLVSPDGTSLRKLTTFQAGYPVWSPDGNYLAIEVKREGDFESGTDIMIIDRQGNEVAWLITSPDNEHPIAWSPDNSYILFARDVREGYVSYPDGALWRANIDWANLAKGFLAESSGIFRLTQQVTYIDSVAMTPDGSKILLPEEDGIWIMNADGSEKTLLIPTSIFPGKFSIDSVAWVPQLNKIAVVATELVDWHEREGFDGPSNIYLLNPDGTGLEQLTFFTGVPCSQAKSLHFPLFAQAKQRSGMREKMMVHKETKKVARGEAKEVEKQSFKIALRTACNSKGLSINEGSSESKRAPIFAGALSLSALGYALWKLLKILG